MYVHNDWCNNSKIIDRHCSPDLEVLSVICRPFYLVITVYIPPDANVSAALLHTTVGKHQQTHPDVVYIIADHFNQACSRTVLC